MYRESRSDSRFLQISQFEQNYCNDIYCSRNINRLRFLGDSYQNAFLKPVMNGAQIEIFFH